MRPTTPPITLRYLILLICALFICALFTRAYAQDVLELPDYKLGWYEARRFNTSAEIYSAERIKTIEKSSRHLSEQEGSGFQRIALDSIGRIVRIEEFRKAMELESVTTITYKGQRMEPLSKTKSSITDPDLVWKTQYVFDRKGQLRTLKETTGRNGKVSIKRHFKFMRQANGLPAKIIERQHDRKEHTKIMARKEYFWDESTRQLVIWAEGKYKSTYVMNADMTVARVISANQGSAYYEYNNGRLVHFEILGVNSAKTVTMDYAYDDRGLLTLITICDDRPSAGCKEIRYEYMQD